MADDLATLGIRVDASQVDQGRISLDKMTVSGKGTEAEIGNIKRATDQLNVSLGNTHGAAAKAVDSLTLSRLQIMELTGVARHSFDALAAGMNPVTVLTTHIATLGQAASLGGMSIGQMAKAVGVSLGILQRVPAATNAATAATLELSAANEGLAASATEAAAAEGVALAPLGIALAGVAAVAGVAAAAFFGWKHSLDKAADNKDFLKSLGLTHKEIRKVKDSSVSLGDIWHGLMTTAGDLWKVIDKGGGATRTLGGAFQWVGDVIGSVLGYITKAFEMQVANFVGGARAIVATWNKIPGAIGDAAISAVNVVITAVQSMVNASLRGVGSLMDRLGIKNGLSGVNIDLSGLKLKNPFEGQAKAWGNAFGEEWVQGYSEAIKAMDKLGADIIDASHKRLTDKYEKDPKKQKIKHNPLYDVSDFWKDKQFDFQKGIGVSLEHMPSDGVEPFDKLSKSLKNIPELLRPAQDAFKAFGKTVSESLGSAIAYGTNLGSAIDNAFKRMEASYITNKISSIFDMIGQKIGTYGNGSGFWNEVSQFFSAGAAPHYASGTAFHPGGPAIINDTGSGRGEIVDLPRGSRVYPAGQSAQMQQTSQQDLSAAAAHLAMVLSGQLQQTERRANSFARKSLADYNRSAAQRQASLTALGTAS